LRRNILEVDASQSSSLPPIRPRAGLAFFAYSANYPIDIDNAVIIDVEARTAIRPAEVLRQDE
jgi:hypothetical protein